MKTSVSQTSIDCHRVIGNLMVDQEKKVLLCMEIGQAYTRRELGVLAGIENSAAARVVNGLVKSGAVIESGVKRCRHTNMTVGAVTLSLTEGA